MGLICRYCGREIAPADFVATVGYWGGGEYSSHRACKVEGMKAEAYECQVIDADCNDCKHFKRGRLEERMLSCMENGKASVRKVNMGWFSGHCLKFDKPTIGQPNKATGHGCFEHRRTRFVLGEEEWLKFVEMLEAPARKIGGLRELMVDRSVFEK